MSGNSRTGLFVVALILIIGTAVSYAAATTVSCDNPSFGLSPYTWKSTGSGADARAEATMPGAYFKTIVNGTKTIGLVIDGTANNGCPTTSMPVIEYSVDDGPFTVVPLTRTGAVYTLPVAQELDAATSHKLELYFRAADLTNQRWTSPMTHLRIVGISLDKGGALASYPMRSKKAIVYGDSITEGVGVDSKFTSWQILGPNNARCTWFPYVCSALDCEYGQFGSGGQGMVRTGLELPPLPNTWDHYDAATSRLLNGLLLPEPDYIFCNMGTNDSGGLNITSAYTDWLIAVRKACPHTRFFCVVPPSGVHRGEIEAVVAARNSAGDKRVYLIDIPSLNTTIRFAVGATQMTYDGAHPTQWGQGMFGANVAVKAQEILSKEKQDIP
ncbi:MAG: GDSL-type esterase/lipase family protein [Armatimonadetes bacterium]|nr:GDSL-type esterase/lipase family protein [Armatimonadota bacterium]